MQAGYSSAVQFLKSKHADVSPFLSTVLILLHEVGQVQRHSSVPSNVG